MYVRDVKASLTRPIKELKGFKKVFIQKGETKNISIELNIGDLGFYNRGLEYIVEEGKFEIMVGTNSEDFISVEINVIP